MSKIKQAIEEARVVRLEPNDVIVLECDFRMPPEATRELTRQVREQFGEDRKVVVLAQGITMRAYRPVGEQPEVEAALAGQGNA